MDSMQSNELLLLSLEHERGGVKIYRTALKCALRSDEEVRNVKSAAAAARAEATRLEKH